MPREHRPSPVVDRSLKARSKAFSNPFTPLPEVRLIPIGSIRMDGSAQHRIAPDPNIIKEYAELMRAGVEFPPMSVRYDGTDNWPSDGFQRLAARKLAEFSEIRAEVRPGTKEDAQWDSYAANATHGLRRTPAETETVIRLALEHPNAAEFSHVQMAKHLHIPLTTLCRHRERLIIATGKDSGTRSVTRGDTTYEMDVTGIGKKRRECRTKPHRDIRSDLATAKKESSPTVLPLLNIIEHWVLSPKCDSARFLDAIEVYLWGHRTEFVEPRTWRLPDGGKCPQQINLAASEVRHD